jgi:hypothetical protein
MALSLLFVLFLLAGAAAFVWWLVMLVEALRIPSSRWESAGENQLLYVLLMVFLGVLGTILYVVNPRPRLR